MKESIYWKKCLMKVAQQPQKPLSGSNQIWDTTSDKKDTSQQPLLSPQSAREAPKKPAKRDSYKYLINFYYRKMCLHSRFYNTNVQKENKSIICDWKKMHFFHFRLFNFGYYWIPFTWQNPSHWHQFIKFLLFRSSALSNWHVAFHRWNA